MLKFHAAEQTRAVVMAYLEGRRSTALQRGGIQLVADRKDVFVKGGVDGS